MTRAELLDRLDVLLGGRVAEELIFGDISTGAQDDLQRATDMARAMVARYEMSEALGLATFEAPRQALFRPVDGAARVQRGDRASHRRSWRPRRRRRRRQPDARTMKRCPVLTVRAR